MNVLVITSVLGLLPSLYPIYRINRKLELNLFDFIILFHTLNFALVPLWKGNIMHWSDIGIIETFLYYISFVVLLLCLDFFWHYLYEDRESLINITAYLKKYNRFKISRTGSIILFMVLVISLVFYMPKATYILHLEDAGVVMEHDEKVYTALLGSIFNIAGLILILYFSYNIKRLSLKDYRLWMFVAYVIMNLFFPRRVFLLLLLQVTICLYAVHRNIFNFKVISFGCGLAIFLYLLYFPFYNIMRYGSGTVFFNPSAPIESLVKLSSYAIDNWDTMNKEATTASDNRSLNLFDAIYDLIYYNPKPYYGELTWKAIDISIPKVLNPNKGEGSASILEKATKHNTDQADSYLLIAYGDYHYFGGFYALIIYFVLFSIYASYCRLLKKFFDVDILSLYFALMLFSFTWNVETSLDGCLSWFFSSVPSLAVLILLEKINMIRIRKTNEEVLLKLILLSKYILKKHNRKHENPLYLS